MRSMRRRGYIDLEEHDMPTGISWTDETWNPFVGCSRVSAGCEHCYAERQAARLATFPHTKDRYAPTIRKTASGPRWTGEISLVPHLLDQPLRWTKPRRIFVNSMSDPFHPKVPFEYIFKCFEVMNQASQHTFQVLTKRPERMLEFFDGYRNYGWPLDNVWLGVSAEDQKSAEERVPILLKTPAAARVVSAEPLLGPIRFDRLMIPENCDRYDGPWMLVHNAMTGFHATSPYSGMEGPSLDQVIIGGESGPGARPCEIAWIRDIRDQCKATRVACFVKQLGAKSGSHAITHPKGGDPTEWPEDIRVQEFPEQEAARLARCQEGAQS